MRDCNSARYLIHGRPRTCARRAGPHERNDTSQRSLAERCFGRTNPMRPAAVLAKRTHQVPPGGLGRTNPPGTDRCLGRTNPLATAKCLGRTNPTGAPRCFGRTNPTRPAAVLAKRTHQVPPGVLAERTQRAPPGVLAERTQRGRPLSWRNEPTRYRPVSWQNEANNPFGQCVPALRAQARARPGHEQLTRTNRIEARSQMPGFARARERQPAVYGAKRRNHPADKPRDFDLSFVPVTDVKPIGPSTRRWSTERGGVHAGNNRRTSSCPRAD